MKPEGAPELFKYGGAKGRGGNQWGGGVKGSDHERSESPKRSSTPNNLLRKEKICDVRAWGCWDPWKSKRRLVKGKSHLLQPGQAGSHSQGEVNIG